jgi:hypothetical protein
MIGSLHFHWVYRGPQPGAGHPPTPLHARTPPWHLRPGIQPRLADEVEDADDLLPRTAEPKVRIFWLK